MTVDNAVRRKTISWADPVATADAGRAMPGLEFLTAMAQGRLPAPPIAAHLGMRLVSVRDGEAHFAAVPDESLYNPIGSVHGGVAATMLDSAVGCAVHTTLPAGVGYTSVELKVSFVRAVTATSGEIHARGRVVKGGSRIAFAEADLRDADGTLLATASSTLLILRP
ncbi:MAG TPA: PaaI family thioesterase [Amycolatopsis sp.]|nr:PaaI family thioesterase [Amycolatopsis sp.]